MKINKCYRNIEDSYLFSTISKKVSEYKEKNPQADIIRLGIGDVTRPLCPAVTEAMHRAVDEMSKIETFHGYGPEQGYKFLRDAICKNYKKLGVDINSGEVFISDGAKSDVGNILDLFDKENTVLIPNPVYPVYVDTNVMDGRKIIYLDANEENKFLPMPPNGIKADIIYICSPNNPTGATYSKIQLKKWVDYALDSKAIILYDAAYEAFIEDDNLARSIFQIDGADKCAIEICSFSKTAGFTGTRCGYTVISDELKFDGMSINKMWLRRQSTKFNGVSYVVQRGAEAVFKEEGKLQVMESINYYKENAKIISDLMKNFGTWFTGGKNSPYIWFKCPSGMKSWDYFDYLLEKANIVGTPGIGFGENGEGFFRLSAFGSRENIIKATERIKSLKALAQ